MYFCWAPHALKSESYWRNGDQIIIDLYWIYEIAQERKKSCPGFWPKEQKRKLKILDCYAREGIFDQKHERTLQEEEESMEIIV